MVYGASQSSGRYYERTMTSLAKIGGPRVSVVGSSDGVYNKIFLPYKQCFIVKFFIKERKYNNECYRTYKTIRRSYPG